MIEVDGIHMHASVIAKACVEEWERTLAAEGLSIEPNGDVMHEATMHTTPRFPRLLAALTLALACAASEEKSNLEKCAADEKCLVAMHAVDNAQNTVNTVCPQDEHETNAACDAAMDARNSAEELQEKLQPK